MSRSLYDTSRWRRLAARARRRDGSRCTVARLLGGECSGGTPHVHHVRPVAEGGAPYDLENVATVCPSHHPVWETLRRRILGGLEQRDPDPPRCRHFHRTLDARLECEARLVRDHARRRVAAA